MTDNLQARLREAEKENEELRLWRAQASDTISSLTLQRQELSARVQELEAALRTIAFWRDHDSRPEEGELEDFARSALGRNAK